jgi:hypothetical protein
VEVALPAVAEDDRLAVDQRVVHGQAANRLRDPRESIP